jgi:hypothetical protein
MMRVPNRYSGPSADIQPLTRTHSKRVRANGGDGRNRLSMHRGAVSGRRLGARPHITPGLDGEIPF